MIKENKQNNTNKFAKGFTLIELLVVVLIIGILAGIALPQYENAVEKSKVSEALLTLKNLRDQQALCFLEKGQDADECKQGEDNLFTYANILDGDPDPDCTDAACGPATKNFSYYLDGEFIGANRRPVDTKYRLETTALEGNDHRICCLSFDDTKNYCKIIGFTQQRDQWCWLQP